MKSKLKAPIKVKVNDLVNPIGISNSDIYFSYKVNSRVDNCLIGGYRIVCASSLENLNNGKYDLWDSKKVKGNICSNIAYEGKKIPFESTVYFKIGCYDENGLFSGFSKIFTFETTLEKFTANWVFKEDFNGAVPLFFQRFNNNGAIKKARLFITGLGYYESFINGKSTDEYKLKPLVTVYDKRPLNGILDYYFNNPKTCIYYSVFDITNLLEKENRIEVLVGNGWYYHKEKQVEGNFSYNTPRTIFEIHIDYEDGKKEIIKSGKETFVKNSHILASTLWKGESVDFRLLGESRNLKSAEKAIIADEEPTGELLPTICPLDKVRRVYNGKIIYKKGNKVVVDFGKNHSGVIRINAKGNSGDKITVVYGEEIHKDKTVDHNSTSWGILIQTDEVILDNGECLFMPKFTYHGYRYAELTLEGNIELLSVKSCEINSDCKVSSKLNSSLKIVDDINRIYINTELSNLHGGYPSDCPHREKRGFLGDAQVTVDAALTSLDLHSMYLKWIKDIVDSQEPSGYVPHTAPFAGGGGGPMYGSAIGIIPMSVYEHTLDKKCLLITFEPLLRWIKYLNTRHNGDYIVNQEEQGWCLGDWLSPKQIYIDADYVNTCALLMCCNLYEKYCEILEDFSHLDEIKELKNKVINSINKNFFNSKTFEYDENKNGANIFALVFGAVEDKYKKQVIAKTIDFYRNNPEINTGIVGTRLLFDFLSENGAADIALKILKNRKYPSYGFMLSKGATTLWECWEEKTTPDFFINKKDQMKGYPVSHNHPMFGSVNSWIFEKIAGLDLRNLYKGEVVIRPLYINEIRKLEASRETVFGQLGITYKTNKNKIILNLIVPVGIKAKLVVNNETIFVGSGHHSFVMRLN